MDAVSRRNRLPRAGGPRAKSKSTDDDSTPTPAQHSKRSRSQAAPTRKSTTPASSQKAPVKTVKSPVPRAERTQPAESSAESAGHVPASKMMMSRRASAPASANNLLQNLEEQLAQYGWAPARALHEESRSGSHSHRGTRRARSVSAGTRLSKLTITHDDNMWPALSPSQADRKGKGSALADSGSLVSLDGLSDLAVTPVSSVCSTPARAPADSLSVSLMSTPVRQPDFLGIDTPTREFAQTDSLESLSGDSYREPLASKHREHQGARDSENVSPCHSRNHSAPTARPTTSTSGVA